MATRIKTITVPFNFDAPADLANNTLTLVGNNTIYIPENNAGTPVTFKDVTLYLTQQDLSTATGATIGDYDANVCLQGATSSVFSETADLTHSGENMSGVFNINAGFTSHFASNFGTGQSKTCLISARISRTTGTGVTTRGVYAWMDITYSYDDTQPTHIKTICYPFSNVSGPFTSTANTSMGDIPILTGAGGMLSESANTIRHMWVKLHGNHCISAGTAGSQLSANTGGATVAFPISQSNLATDLYRVYLYNANSITTTAPWSFRAWSNNATRWHNLVGELWITYEFNAANTTNVLNYVEVPFHYDIFKIGGMTGSAGTSNASIINKTILIPEPGTILPVRQAAIFYYTASSGNNTPQIKIGTQSGYTGYVSTTSVGAGMCCLQHRFDTGGSGDSGHTFVSGENTFNVCFARASTGSNIGDVTGKIRVLYHSGVSANGISAHNHVIRSLSKNMQMTAATGNTVNAMIEIGDSNYWWTGFGMHFHRWEGSQNNPWDIIIKQNVGEGAESFNRVYNTGADKSNEIGYYLNTPNFDKIFKRYPQDLDTTRMEANTTRPININCGVNGSWAYGFEGTVHHITYTWSGNLANTQGGNCTIYLCRADTGERMFKTHFTGNGTYTIKTYDNQVQYFAEAYENNVSMGRSNTSNAV
jgi:hypothetical protein